MHEIYNKCYIAKIYSETTMERRNERTYDYYYLLSILVLSYCFSNDAEYSTKSLNDSNSSLFIGVNTLHDRQNCWGTPVIISYEQRHPMIDTLAARTEIIVGL